MIKAQKLAAWKEVAQGIAHEIKNPLTPIQLNAQRLLKKFHENKEDFARIFDESIKIISQEVANMKELLDQKACGEMFQVSIWTEQYTRFAEDHWAHKAATLGGGQLFSHGCHYIDLLLWYLGNPVEGCHIGTNFGTPWMEWEGTSDVFIKFESGAVGYHGGTWGAKGSRLGYAFHAHGTEGMLELDFSKGRLSLRCGGTEETLAESETGMKHAARQMAHFLDCIQMGANPITDGPGSLQGLRVIWRLYEAERNHTVADLRGLGLPAPLR